jgi:hypothetical protein
MKSPHITRQAGAGSTIYQILKKKYKENFRNVFSQIQMTMPPDG